MSDAMASRQPGQFNSFWDKSVSAYQRLLDLQRSRIPFMVHTRLGTYSNMLIESISAPDDASTQNGMRCTVVMREVLVAQVAQEKVSARAWTTGAQTNRGQVQPREKETVLYKVENGGIFGDLSTGGFFRG